MTSNNALTLKGSNPSGINNFLNKNFGVPLPKSSVAPLSNAQNNFTNNFGQPKTSGMIPQKPPEPSTPLKKVTHTDTMGNIMTHEYYDKKTGLLTPEGKTAGKPEVNAPVSQSQTPPPTPPPTPTYPGLITNLTNQQNSPQNQTTQKSTGMLQDISGKNLGNSGPAYNDYQTSVQELADLKKSIAEQTGNIESQPISMQFQQGRKQALERQNAALLDAAQQKVNEKAAALGFGIQGQGQQQTGLTSAGNLGIAGQGLVQSGLLGAAGLAQPQLGQIGQVPFSPLTQEQGNVLGSQGGGLGAAANLLGGFEGAKNTASTQYQQTEQYKSAHQQAQNLQSQLTDLISTFGLNPADLNIANAGIQKIAQNTSDARYKILQNYLADVASRYSQILTPVGGAATDTTRAVATSMLDSIASGKSIIDVLNALDQQAAAVVSGVKTNNTGQAPSSNTGAITWDNIGD